MKPLTYYRYLSMEKSRAKNEEGSNSIYWTATVGNGREAPPSRVRVINLEVQLSQLLAAFENASHS